MKPGFGPPVLVVARYALTSLCASRLFVAFLVFCCLPALALLVLVFVRHNTEGSGLLEFVEAVLSQLLPLNIWLVDAVRPPSLAAAFLVVLVAGPALVAPDMRGNAMPLYLSRPLGKLTMWSASCWRCLRWRWPLVGCRGCWCSSRRAVSSALTGCANMRAFRSL